MEVYIVIKAFVVVASISLVLFTGAKTYITLQRSGDIFTSPTCEARESLTFDEPIRGFAEVLAIESAETLIVKIVDDKSFSKLRSSANSVCKAGHFISPEKRSVRFRLANVSSNKLVKRSDFNQFRTELSKAIAGHRFAFECYSHSERGELQCLMAAGRADIGLYEISAGFATYDTSKFESPLMDKQYRMAQELAHETRESLRAASLAQ